MTFANDPKSRLREFSSSELLALVGLLNAEHPDEPAIVHISEKLGYEQISGWTQWEEPL